MGTLTAAQVTEFAEQGYVVLEDQFSPAELEQARSEAAVILALALDSSLALGKRNPRMEIDVLDGAVRVRKVQPVNDLSEVIASLSYDPRLIDPMRELMGDEPVLMEEKLNFKQTVPTGDLDFSFIHRTTPEGFPLHHDWGYYRTQGYPEDTISSAIALDDCAGRGPIRVIPGSHLIDAPLADDEGDQWGQSGVVAEGFMADEPRVDINATAGSVMLFHAKLLHDSEPNDSGRPRRLMIYSHYPRSHDPDGDPDRRNRPIREYAGEFERRYRAALADGSAVAAITVEHTAGPGDPTSRSPR